MIKWVGPVFDSAGYTDANRNYISALHSLNIDLTVSPMVPFTEKHELNEITKLILKLSEKKILYEYVIHHYTPERVHTIIEKDKINIGYNTWETDLLPKHWVERMNDSLDAVFVPSQFNKDVYEKSGIKLPIEVIPHCLDYEQYVHYDKEINFTEKQGVFKFISVFQWTERKNPIALLKAYFSEFTENDNVVLILKTYRSNSSLAEQKIIKNEIMRLKNDMNLRYYPPIYFVGEIITKAELMSLYKQSDCFVLPTRAEGFGIPYAEAALQKNTIIATGYGGQTDFLNNDYTSFIKYQMTPVLGMYWIPNYNAHMNWAEPNICHLKELMREKYFVKQNYPKIFAEQQIKATEDMKNKLSYDIIGNQLLTAIEKYV